MSQRIGGRLGLYFSSPFRQRYLEEDQYRPSRVQSFASYISVKSMSWQAQHLRNSYYYELLCFPGEVCHMYNHMYSQMSPSVRPEELESEEPSSNKILRLKNLLHNFGRSGPVFCDDRAQPVEPWTIFQSKVESDWLTDPATMLFNPIVMASPTDFSTVYTTLKRTKEQMNALGQFVCPIFFDMGLLSKALEIVWANKSELDGVVPLEGGMHLLMACFSGIGFLYAEIGLKELLYESHVFVSRPFFYLEYVFI